MKKRGLLVLNLGTPDSPEPKDVGRYLKEFLMDKWVIDIPAIFRWILVHILIVPKRKYASSHAYKTIWTERGSPLAFHLKDLRDQLVKFLGDDFQVESAMRYQNPSIESALRSFVETKVEEIVVFPLYPQYAESSTRSSREEIEKVALRLGLSGRINFVQDFYDDPGFIEAFVTRIRPSLKNDTHLLMSFHSLPETHVQKTDPSGSHCLKKTNCCDQITDVNRLCYRAQCYASARLIAERLGLSRDQWSVSFQSRLGRAEWLKPTTETTLPALGKKGGSLVVATPSFASDCLETIEEIGDRGRLLFLSAGGKSFTRIECLNAGEDWAQAIARIVRAK
jgi:ferrochelatase